MGAVFGHNCMVTDQSTGGISVSPTGSGVQEGKGALTIILGSPSLLPKVVLPLFLPGRELGDSTSFEILESRSQFLDDHLPAVGA